MGEREGYTTWEFPIRKALKYFAIVWFVGVICGAVGITIAWKTDWYQRLGTLVGSFLWVNWWVSPFLLGVLVVAVYFDRRAKSRKTYGRY